MTALIAAVAWHETSGRFAKQDQLLINIGEIRRIDEILTNSALLAASTGDLAYQQRYFDHVDELDQVISETLALFENSRADDRIAEVSAANLALVSIETRAIKISGKEPNAEALAMLKSKDYRQNKQRYSNGIEQAFVELKTSADHQISLMRLAIWSFALSALGFTLVMLRTFWVSKLDRIRRESQDAKLETIRAMLNTFMDLQNNLLNNMVYFRTKAAHNLAFDEDEISLIDHEIASAKEKLASISQTEFAETRDLGGIVVVTTDGDHARSKAA